MTFHNKRDEKGWRIPKPGSKSALIYRLMKQGMKRREILPHVGGSNAALGVLMWKIRNCELSNKREMKYQKS